MGSCRSTATSDDCKARLVRFPCKMRYLRITGFSFLLQLLWQNWQSQQCSCESHHISATPPLHSQTCENLCHVHSWSPKHPCFGIKADTKKQPKIPKASQCSVRILHLQHRALTAFTSVRYRYFITNLHVQMLHSHHTPLSHCPAHCHTNIKHTPLSHCHAHCHTNITLHYLIVLLTVTQTTH